MVIVGGVDFSTEGWGEAEVHRRKYSSKHSKIHAGSVYGGAKVINSQDVVQSVFDTRNERGALYNASMALSQQLAKSSTPDDLFAAASPIDTQQFGRDLAIFAKDTRQKTNVETLNEINECLIKMARPLGLQLPALSSDTILFGTRTVDTSDSSRVTRFEASIVPHIHKIELIQAELSANMSALTDAMGASPSALTGAYPSALTGAVPSTTGGDRWDDNKDTKTTRGEEIDKAIIPKFLLKEGFGPETSKIEFRFDISPNNEDSIILINNGLYWGEYRVNTPSRSTLLSPEQLEISAFMTSSRVYAWAVFDSPEGVYILRYKSVDGHVSTITKEDLTAWISKNITGSPPHKMLVTKYVAYLRSKGFEIHEGLRREKYVRFILSDFMLDHDRKAELKKLRMYDQQFFDKLDWSEYDSKIQKIAREEITEHAGDVIIDNSVLKVLKIRSGMPWGVQTHYRSFITYHTHPNSRYKGAMPEIPSGQDLCATLRECARDLLGWSFVTAAEGTYILRPSEMLISLYLRTPATTIEDLQRVYDMFSDCRNSAVKCVYTAYQHTLVNCGFISYFHHNKTYKMLDIPDAIPQMNSLVRSVVIKQYRRFKQMSAADIAKINFNLIDEKNGSDVLTSHGMSIISCTTDEKGILELNFNEEFESPELQESYLETPGPLLVIYFHNDEIFLEKIPEAALRASKKFTSQVAWFIFMSYRRITVFRNIATGIEVYGPVKRKFYN